jgi:lipopolysaccharide transport system permease protein
VSATPDSLAGNVRALAREAAPTAETELEPVVVEDYHPSLWASIRESWHSRHVVWALAMNALMGFIVKYRLGPFWIIFSTLMGVVGWSLIGGKVAGFSAPNGMPYFLYTMVGLMGWQLFQSTLMITARAFLRMKTLIKDVYFPLILVPIAGSSQALFKFALLMVTYVGTVLFYWLDKGQFYARLGPKYIVYSVLGLFLCVALAWGISLWTAPLTAHTRDVRMLIRYVTPFLFFVTPVLYPIDHLKGSTRRIAELNPLSSPVEMAKVGLTGAGSVRLYAALWSIVAISLVFASGIWFMNRFGARIVGLDQEDDEDDAFL